MKHIKNNVYLLESGKFVNIYALIKDKGVLLIDTGIPDKAESIFEELKTIGVSFNDIKAIIITHAHPDHAGSAYTLVHRTGAKLYIHKLDHDILLGKIKLPEPHSFAARLFVFITNRFWQYHPPENAIPIDEGFSIEGFPDIKLIFTPGHTQGSISILDMENNILFCGDAINNRGNKLTGPNKLFTIDMNQGWHSVSKIAEINFNILCPGHGPWIDHNARDRVQSLISN